ncbi:pote ankyrin domain family member f [Plakobranchus ocellatus]|uniref:Pote ankyrin domain family member f n=1 Tax=Plakobranchus ocellatus TaxID=259542 RepID=A0AAV4AXR8_9GAST|nr:pote ankyrin domain family member f [Plakobranchus ocellatus]
MSSAYESLVMYGLSHRCWSSRLGKWCRKKVCLVSKPSTLGRVWDRDLLILVWMKHSLGKWCSCGRYSGGSLALGRVWDRDLLILVWMKHSVGKWCSCGRYSGGSLDSRSCMG